MTTCVEKDAYCTSTAFQPLYGQTANIFGRRWLIILAVSFFMLGSGISGGATSMAMLIAGRTVQGVGGGGCAMLLDLIICDLVPLRERGSVMGYLFGAATVGTALGPFIGGATVATTTWRWVFYINLPIGFVALILLIAFLKVEWERESSISQKLKRTDFIGNSLFVTAVGALLIALTNGGTIHQWSSWRTILPLVLGISGLALFVSYEMSPLCSNPSLPRHLFANRTSATAFFLTFLHTGFMYWEIYFMPVYFQAVQGSSPMRSGVQLLPTVLCLMAFAMVGGIVMEKTGRYLPIHATGFGLMVVGFGLFTLLNASTSTALWVISQIVFASGAGLAIGTLLPAAQAELSEKDTATAAGTWAVMRSFGTIVGVTIAAVIFNNRFSHLATRIADSSVRTMLVGGHAYEHGTSLFIDTLKDMPETRAQVMSCFQDSLQLMWQIAISFAGFGFLCVFLQKEVTMRTKLDTEFGMSQKTADGSRG